MKTVVIEIKDQKAIALLQDMEKKKLIRIEDTNTKGHKPSKSLGGKLSSESAQSLQQQASVIRKEWDRNF